MRGQALVAVTALATALAATQPAAAQNYPSYHDAHVAQAQQCAQQRSGSTVGGAVLGGILGAVVGSNVAARRHRGDGALLGAAVGAMAGGAMGRNSAQRTCNERVEGAYDPYYGQPQGQYSQGQYGQGQYSQPQYDPRDRNGELLGGPYQRSAYNDRNDRAGRDNCRWGETVTRDPDGYEIRDSVYMCRGRDGVWRPQERY